MNDRENKTCPHCHKDIDLPLKLKVVTKELWQAYKDMRKKIKKPMTKHAEKLAFEKLAELEDHGENPVRVIEQSIFNSWQGLFPVRKDDIVKPAPQYNQPPVVDKDLYKTTPEEAKANKAKIMAMTGKLGDKMRRFIGE